MAPFVPATPSRSAVVAREECNRMRLLEYDLDGHGYVPAQGSVALMSGIHIHEGFAALLDPLEPKSLDEAISLMKAAYSADIVSRGLRQVEGEQIERVQREQLFMLECMLRGWVKVRMANFLEEYEVVSVERAWSWPLAPQLILPLRMDAIVRRRADGLLHVPDFKGCSSGDSMWADTFEMARQTILYLTALEEVTSEGVGGMLYEGVVRGQFRKDTAKSSPFFGQRIQYTPYCYAYKKYDLKKGEWVYRPDYTNAKGWEKFFVGDVFTPEQWVDQLEMFQISTDDTVQSVLSQLFIAGQPLSPPQRIRQSMRRQIANGERQWFSDVTKFHELRATLGWDHPTVQEFLELFAPQITGRCTKYGADHRCAFYNEGFCFLENSLELIRDDEAFVPRVPHHANQEPN